MAAGREVTHNKPLAPGQDTERLQRLAIPEADRAVEATASQHSGGGSKYESAHGWRSCRGAQWQPCFSIAELDDIVEALCAAARRHQPAIGTEREEVHTHDVRLDRLSKRVKTVRVKEPNLAGLTARR